MSICIKCGAIVHNDDIPTHKCRQEDLPIKGKEKIPTTTDVSK